MRISIPVVTNLNKKSKKGTILRVSAYLFRYKSLFWLTIALASGMTAMEIAVPLAIERILENIENQQDSRPKKFGRGLAPVWARLQKTIEII